MITPHTLRHSFATQQIGEGLGLEELRQSARPRQYRHDPDLLPAGGAVAKDVAVTSGV